MKSLIQLLLREEGGYYGNVITRKLPQELDNSLYTLIHFLGKFDFEDVITFADNATPKEIEELEELIGLFPSRQHEIIVSAGGFSELRNSELYSQIIDFVKNVGHEELIKEVNSSFNRELRLGDSNISFHGVTQEVKQALFKQWDKVGHADWKILRYLNITMGDEDSAFNDVLDIIYPVLRIEWEGGIKGTSAYDDSNEWGSYRTDMPGVDGNDYEYRVIPVGYDFGFDQSVDFGDSGYSCWDIMVEFRPSFPNGVILWNGLIIGEDLFDKMNYPLQSYRGYDSDEMDLLEDIWGSEHVNNGLGDYFNSFCQVGVKVY